MQVYKALASVSGIGYIGRGGGTVAAVAACLPWYAAAPGITAQALLIVAVTAIGVYAGGKVERDWGKDSPKVVIDEVAGMWLSLFAIPVTPAYVAAGLVLFRVFDIAKPLFIRRMERAAGGWGVMLDDLLAGLYANIVLQLAVHLNLF